MRDERERMRQAVEMLPSDPRPTAPLVRTVSCEDWQLAQGGMVLRGASLGLVVQVYQRTNPDQDNRIVVWFPGGVPGDMKCFLTGHPEMVDMGLSMAIAELRVVPGFVPRVQG